MKADHLKSGLFLIAVLIFVPLILPAQTIDLRKAEILTSLNIKSTLRETDIRALQEEVEKRTSLKLGVWSGKSVAPLFILANNNNEE